MVWLLIAEVAGASPAALVLLAGLLGAGLLFRKSKAAAAVMVLGLGCLAATLVWDLAAVFLLRWAAGTALPPMVPQLGVSVVHGVGRACGVLMLMIAACIGPAPARPEEEY